MIAFTLFYLLEASIRKYFFANTLLILVKYVPLLLFLKKHLQKLSIVYFILFLIPLWALVPSLDTLPYAAYDFLAIALVPCLFIAISGLTLPLPLKKRISQLCLFGGLANSTMIIVQFFVGPTHFLSQTVDQQFSQHTYAELFQKAPGIAASSSAYITVAGLIAALSLFNTNSFPKNLLRTCIAVSSLSIVFNLASRSYVYGVVLFLLIYFFSRFLLIPSKNMLPQAGAVILSLFGLYSYVGNNVDNIERSNRSVNDISEMTERIGQFFPLEQLELQLPIFGGLGLGSTVNNNIYSDPESLPQCRSFFEEYEFTRYVCSFGMFGYFVIIVRFLIVFFLLRRAINLLRSKSLIQASGFFYVAFSLFFAAQLKTNDVSSGLLLIAIASAAAITPPYLYSCETETYA